MGFYDQVLRELLVALGAALFIGNLLALVRRRAPASLAKEGDVLGRAPLARTAAFLVIGLIVMVWGIASLTMS